MGKKILVAYFSTSGVTAKAARKLAEVSAADLFEIKPVIPYTSADLNWMDKKSRSSIEMNDLSSRPAIADRLPDMEKYDIIFVGFPIWWGIAAWLVDTFIKANDFTGKTVIPFCTSSSSDLGESGKLLADMAGAGEWQDGERFQSSVSAADVQDWVKGLGY